MKKTFLLFSGLIFSLFACTEKQDSLIGNWKADKVNVQFDESRSTPELVKQIGEMEKQNHISIDADSLLVFSSLDGSFQGQLTLDETGTLYCNGNVFGQWKNGEIVTKTPSPLGEITVKYRKE